MTLWSISHKVMYVVDEHDTDRYPAKHHRSGIYHLQMHKQISHLNYEKAIAVIMNHVSCLSL